MDGLSWNTLLKWMIWEDVSHYFWKHPYTKTPNLTPQDLTRRIDPEVEAEKHPRLQEVRSKDLFLQQVLVKEAVWIPRRDLKICVPLFFSKKKKQLHHPTQGVILEMFFVFFKRKFPKVLFFGWSSIPWQISSFCQNCLKIWSMKKSWKTTALVSPNPNFSFSNYPGTLHNHLLMDGNFQAFPI